MSAKKLIRQHQNKVLYLSLICMAQTCVIQFFPLYLKHLNLAAFEVGLIRACQVWLSTLLLPVWFSLTKHLYSASRKRIIFCVLQFLIISAYLYLTFMPLSDELQDVTHCHKNDMLSRKGGKVTSAHSGIKNNYTLSNVRVHSNPYKDIDHRRPNIKNVNAWDSMKTNVSDSEQSHKNILINVSNQNFRNNLAQISTVLPLNEQRNNFSFFGNNETVLNGTINSSKRMHTSNFQDTVLNLKHPNVSSTEKITHSIKYVKKTNDSEIHQNYIPSSLHKDNSIHDITISTLSNDEDYTKLHVTPTESTYDFEVNSKNNLKLNYNAILSLNKSIIYHKIHNNRKHTENVSNSNSGYYENQDVPTLPLEDKVSDAGGDMVTYNTEETSKATKYLTEENVHNDTFGHQKQILYPWPRIHDTSVHHKTTKSGNSEENDSQLQPSDKSQETDKINTYQYVTKDSDRENNQLHNRKHYMKSHNDHKFDAYDKENENPSEENEDTNEWKVLKRLLQKQRHKREVIHKKHHRIKRHYYNHNAYRRKFHEQNDKLNPFHLHSLPDSSYKKTFKEDRVVRTIRKLMSVDDSEQQDDRGSIKKIHMELLNHDKISQKLFNIIIDAKIHKIFSYTFGTIILIAVLAEVFSRANVATSFQILIPEDRIGDLLHHRIIGYQKENSQQIWTLFVWGIFGCPTIAVLVSFTECSYQPRAFIIFSVILIGIAFLLILFFLQLPETTSELKLKDCEENNNCRDNPFLKRLGYNISIFVVAFAMACNSEYILWYMDTLNGFPYNYQLLYCAYTGVGAVFQAIVKCWLLRREMSASQKIQDFNNSDKGGDGMRNMGCILLGLHFLAASILQPAWSLLFLGILQGCSAAFLVSLRTSGCWAVGYGIGCIAGGLVVNLQSADRLFWIMAGITFIWSAMVTLSRGLLKYIGNNDRDRVSYSQLLLLGEDSDKEEGVVPEEDDVEEEDDWLERALLKDEQEAQRRRIMSCPT